MPALPIQTHTTGGHTLTKVDDGNPFDPKSLEGIGWRKADLAMSGPKTVTRKLLGFQFGNREGHSIQGDNNDPSGLFSFEIMTPLLAATMIERHHSAGLVLIPIFEGDIEDATILSDHNTDLALRRILREIRAGEK